jgi:hypothetical protein
MKMFSRSARICGQILATRLPQAGLPAVKRQSQSEYDIKAASREDFAGRRFAFSAETSKTA